MSWWEEGCLNYAVEIAKKYKADKERILECMECDSVINFLNESYTILTKNGQLQLIENLEKEEKLRLWAESKKHGEDEKKRTLICRSIYLLERLTK